jgi:hypothetical protein
VVWMGIIVSMVSFPSGPQPLNLVNDIKIVNSYVMSMNDSKHLVRILPDLKMNRDFY